MLKPSDVLRPNADDQAKAKELETLIDSELRNYDGKPVEVRLPANTSRRVVDLLVANYRANEWLVDVLAPTGGLPSQVDPDYRLRFDIASPPRSGPGYSPMADVMRRAAGEID